MAAKARITGLGSLNRRLSAIADRAAGKRRRDGMLVVMDRLVAKGRDYAKRDFDAAEFEGEKDVVVKANFGYVGGKPWEIVASGKTVLFIEFGAGINRNPGDHPLASRYGFYRTSWSATHEKWLVPPRVNRVTNYPNTWPHDDEWYQGNPPSKSMYKTAKYIKKEIGYTAIKNWKPNNR